MRSFLIAALTLLLITACGPRWYYHHLDWMIPWYVDDYLALDSGQRSEFERRLAIQLNWHCRTQLTEYATFLKSVSRDFQTPDTTVTREQFVYYLQSLSQYWKDLMAQIGPDVADIVITASDDQIDELFRNIEKENLERQRIYVDPPKREILQNRTDRMVERLERWIGTLTDTQYDAVQQWSRNMGATTDQWLANRRRTQQAFRKLMATRTVDPAFKEKFTALLVSPEVLRTKAYQTQLDRNIALMLNLLTDIEKTLTDAQRSHLLAYLESLAEDFDVLACEIPPKDAQ
ncbi:MAG: hypothetical protein HF981_24935 [Desulfobacteraceae bacterium]|nr:hypothetical protein [Desulfobacteraceae bacterium]MBC2753663.1 hypothetical protein [Desulfobacteraceae bacterium]